MPRKRGDRRRTYLVACFGPEYGARVEAARHHLIGRDEELARISSALRRGGSVLLRGDPGIGKTALLQAHTGPASAVTVTGTGDLPLSAFAHIGDAEWRQPTPTAVAAALYRTTVRRGTSLLIVDDAHWLDPASAGLVLQLARSGTPMLAAARTGLTIPRAIQAVMRQRGETIEVGDLSIDSVRGLMEQQLDAPVSLAFATAVAAKTGGNPLYVREVVSRVRAADAATLRRGVWTLSGSMPVLDVRDLLAERIEQLTGRVRFALELVAVAGELPVVELIEAVGEATVSRGEQEGVVRVADGVARPGHPLQRDTALSLLPAGRRARVHQTLLAVAHRDEATPGGAARRALWRLGGGLEVDTDELLEVAERVFATSVSLAHLLALSAAEQISRPDQAVRLGALWVSLGEGDAADRILEPLPGRFPPGLDVAALGLRVFSSWLVRDRPGDALRLLDDGVAEIGDDPMVEAQRTAVLWRLGRIDEAIRVGERLARDVQAPPDARAAAASTLHSIAVASLDRHTVDARRALVGEILASSDRFLSEGRATLEITIAGHRVLLEEDLEWAESHLRVAFTAALERGEEPEAAQYGAILGWSLALRGRPREATAMMVEFLEVRGPWALVNRGWSSSGYVQALAAAGRAAEARQELERLMADPPAPFFGGEVGRAEVDVLALEGRRPAAIERARHYRGVALSVGDEFGAVSLAWAELLLGSHAAVRPLLALTDRSEVRLHEIQGEFARAMAARDVDGATRAAAALDGLGHRWHALEAANLAATLPAASDWKPLRALHAAILAAGPAIVTRALPARFSGIAADLTSREREVASLASQGLSDKEIADRLVLSVRTVETHMSHVFAKTALHRREDLAEVL